MRCLILLALLLVTVAALAGPTGTLRVDYFHTGNSASDIYSLDRVILEPLPWPGNPDYPLDTLLRGKYLAELLDPESATVLWSRSFNSVFGEWQTTSEAKTMRRSFQESVRFPMPSQKADLVIKQRNAKNAFEEVWRVTIDPKDYQIQHETARYAKDVVSIINNGDSAHKVDLLILGDGYTRAEHDEFVAKARELTDILFSTSPFKERRNDFNVWALAPPADQSGVSRPSTGVYRDSPLGARYDAFGAERYILTFDNTDLRRIASSAPYEFVEIMTNSETYGGGGIFGLYSTVAANSEWAPYIFVHEFGHHFAGLADEYYTSPDVYEPVQNRVEPIEPNVTIETDPAKLKWRALLTAGTPLPTPWPKEEFDAYSHEVQAQRAKLRAGNAPEAKMNQLFRDEREHEEALFSKNPYRKNVGLFEGANYEPEGYYRPQQNCIMFTRTDQFCAVCSAAIDDVIDAFVKTRGH